MTYRILDLYSGAGGAGVGYHQARFDVVGVDFERQPHYPFAFIQADALSLDMRFIRSFDAIHASPPCQKHTALRTMHNAKTHLDLIPPTLAMLEASGLPWIVENVVGAPLPGSIVLCGTMFGLGAGGYDLHRHRQFKANFPLTSGMCKHITGKPVLGIYGGHVRNRRRREGSADRGVADPSFDLACEAMGINFMTLGELSQAIPPAYTRFLGGQLIDYIERPAGEYGSCQVCGATERHSPCSSAACEWTASKRHPSTPSVPTAHLETEMRNLSACAA